MTAIRDGGRLFDPRTLFGIIFVGLLATAGIVWLLAFGDLQSTGSAGRNSYSVAATGHKAMVELLRRRGWPVLSSRFDTAEKAAGGLLVLAEPSAQSLEGNPGLAPDDLGDYLLVLPKRRTLPHPTRPAWALAAPVIDVEEVEDTAAALGLELGVTRLGEDAAARGWQNRLGGGAPALPQAQLLRPVTGLSPLIFAEEGVLLGTFDATGRTITVLSDPDLLANHGLDEGDNAAVMLALFERLAPGAAPIVFDETIHGFVDAPNPFRRLFEPPVLPVTLSLLAAGLLFGWSAASRFGAARRTRRAFELGKSVLIGNMAELLVYGGYRREAVQRYFETAWREVAETLQAPDLEFDRLVEWFEQVGERRRVGARFGDLAARVRDIAEGHVDDAETMIATTRDIHAWRQEMLHGSRRDQTDR